MLPAAKKEAQALKEIQQVIVSRKLQEANKQKAELLFKSVLSRLEANFSSYRTTRKIVEI